MSTSRSSKPRDRQAAQRRLQRKDDHVEDAIRRAEADGAFDDLPGKGKPLRLESTDTDPWWLAHHVLKNAGFAPDWVERSRRIRQAKAQIEALSDRFMDWVERAEPDASRLREALARREAVIRDQIERHNAEVEGYDLVAPAAAARLSRLSADEVVAELRRRVAQTKVDPKAVD